MGRKYHDDTTVPLLRCQRRTKSAGERSRSNARGPRSPPRAPLVARGSTPTVDDVAAAASISRTTAYRYFPNQRALLAAAHPETQTESLLPPHAPDDAGARLDLVIAAFTRLIVDTEAQQRTMLRLSLEADPADRAGLPLRQGRAIRWIEEALAPLRAHLDEAQLRRMVLAIRSATGIEALAWLTDVAGLSREEAVELMRWTAQAIYQAALADQPDGTQLAPGTTFVSYGRIHLVIAPLRLSWSGRWLRWRGSGCRSRNES
jgi:AcrR family transcriptional regulator